jgi:hypothetical protein
VTEVRALLAVLREHEAAERPMTPTDLRIVQAVLFSARMHLTILAPELGDQELIKSVAAELAKLRYLVEA